MSSDDRLSTFGRDAVATFENPNAPDADLERFSTIGRARMHCSRAIIASLRGQPAPVDGHLARAVELLEPCASTRLCRRLRGVRWVHGRGDDTAARRDLRECMQLLDVELRLEVGGDD